MELISCICAVTLFLIIWFKTAAFIEYAKLLRFTKLFKIQQYIDSEIDLSYPAFLLEYYNNFITRLLNCPICTSVWLGLFSSAIVGWSFTVVTVFGLLLYLIVDKLL